jgi:phage replication O-like protein O
MASPQLDDGYTRIAHEILEALCRINLSPYESRVLWFVLRTTYGHHKKADRIALSQIQAATELDKRNASRTLTRLRKRNIILDEGHQMGLQKDHEKWLAVCSKTRGVSRDTVSVETPKECLHRHEKGVCGDTTKDIKIKDIAKGKHSRSKVSDPRIKELTDFWAARYFDRVGEDYPFSPKDFGLFRSVLTSFPFPRLKEVVELFFKTDDRWIKEEAGFTVGVFVSRLPSLASISAVNRNRHTKQSHVERDLTYEN